LWYVVPNTLPVGDRVTEELNVCVSTVDNGGDDDDDDDVDYDDDELFPNPGLDKYERASSCSSFL
jgi:hypothetical protein